MEELIWSKTPYTQFSIHGRTTSSSSFKFIADNEDKIEIILFSSYENMEFFIHTCFFHIIANISSKWMKKIHPKNSRFVVLSYRKMNSFHNFSFNISYRMKWHKQWINSLTDTTSRRSTNNEDIFQEKWWFHFHTYFLI